MEVPIVKPVKSGNVSASSFGKTPAKPMNEPNVPM